MVKFFISRVLIPVCMYCFVLSLTCPSASAFPLSQPQASSTPQINSALDPLSLWEGTDPDSNKQRIIHFVEAAKQTIPPEDRIAVFDNDGTLWAEWPNYFQVDYIQSKLLERKSIQIEDERLIEAYGAQELPSIEVEAYRADVRQFLNTIKGDGATDFAVPYIQLTYQPMIELVEYLQASDFDVYICSGGGIDFVRAFSEEVYGIPRQNVMGSALINVYDPVTKQVLHSGGTGGELEPPDQDYAELDYADGGYPTPPQELQSVILNPFNDKEGKPVGLERYLGKKPIMAVGNSDGDFFMFDYTDSNTAVEEATGGKPLIILLNHDNGCTDVWDESCEYAYNNDVDAGIADTDPTDEIHQDFCKSEDQQYCSLAVAEERDNWLIVSMKDDFRSIFKFSTH
ncbi:MAG: hypothetical protein AAF572_11620 [Cyanobacteria bacterium P01_B01_bin.77]